MSDKVTLLEDDDYDLDDDLPAELPLEAMTPDVERTRRFRARALQGMVRLAPDVAEVFSDSEAVNEALRTLIRLSKAQEQKAA
jgi:hypothetical protein